MAGRFAVVDEHNRFVRWIDRATLHEQRLPHRSVQVIIFDSKGRVVLQRRHRNKETCPNHWDLSCSGHVEESDYLGGPDEELPRVYHEVAERELEEELGVRAELTFLAAFAPEAEVHYEHFHFFIGRSDGPYTMQEEELEEIRVFDQEQLKTLLEGSEPVTRTLRFLLKWLLENGHWPT